MSTVRDAGDYIGSELEIFQLARNWKAYLRRALAPFITGDVAEIGAGIGATARVLVTCRDVRSWLCVEPDRAQLDKVAALVASGDLPGSVRVLCGTLADLPAGPAFDAIVYVDVLEHIEDDRGELRTAMARLNPGGRIVVLSPAWQFLYSPFDKAIGHHRRYSLRSLRAVAPAASHEVAGFYLDGVGFLASLANKLLLRQDMPRTSQILLWDRVMVPVSRIADLFTRRLFGRSVVIVWQTVSRLAAD